MTVHVSHAALPYPIAHARYTIVTRTYATANGIVLTDISGAAAATVSVDAGAFAAAAETPLVVGTGKGAAYTTLSGAETNGTLVLVSITGTSVLAALVEVRPRVLPILNSDTAQAGAAGSLTLALATGPTWNIAGAILRTTGGTGGGGTGGAGNQARVITAYNPATLVATVAPNWETTPDGTTTYDILLSDVAINSIVTRSLRPATDGATLDTAALLAALNTDVLTAGMIMRAR